MKTIGYGRNGTVYQYEMGRPEKGRPTIPAVDAKSRQVYLIKWLPALSGINNGYMLSRVEQMLREQRSDCFWPLDIVYHNGIPEGILLPVTTGYATLEDGYGETLRSLLKHAGEDNCLDLERRVLMARELSESVAGFHEKGDVIVNLFPENIWIENVTGHVRLGACETYALRKKGTDEFFPAFVEDPSRLPEEVNARSGFNDGTLHAKSLDCYLLAGCIYRILTGEAYHAGSVPRKILGEEMSRRFDLILKGSYSPLAGYIEAEEWVKILRVFSTNIISCPDHKGHQYYSSEKEQTVCPWCEERSESPVQRNMDPNPASIPNINSVSMPDSVPFSIRAADSSQDGTAVESIIPDKKEEIPFLYSRLGFLSVCLGLSVLIGLLFRLLVYDSIANSLFPFLYNSFDADSVTGAYRHLHNGITPLLLGYAVSVAFALVVQGKNQRIGIAYWIGFSVIQMAVMILSMLALSIFLSAVSVLIPVFVLMVIGFLFFTGKKNS